LAVAPNDARALVALAALREASGDRSQALATYSRALAANPSQPVVAAKVASLQQAQAGFPPVPGGPAQPFGLTPPPPGAMGATPGPFGTVAR